MSEVDKELVLKWIKALESGDYKQGSNKLKAENVDGDVCYYCLGVVCEVAGLRQVARGTSYHFITNNETHGENIGLPNELGKKLGLTFAGEKMGSLSSDIWDTWKFSDREAVSLAAANDAGRSFVEIAAALRDYYGFPPKGDSDAV